MIPTLILSMSLVIALSWLSVQIRKITKPIKINKSSQEILENHSPHYYWIDYHRSELKGYPNCFVAIHPINGIVFFDSDIKSFTEKYNTTELDRDSLMVLHTSMLKENHGS